MVMIEALRGFTYYKGVPLWRHALVLQWALQIVSGVLVVALVTTFFTNITNTIQEREIPHGFSFLSREYQTPIGQHFLPYESSDTFLYAFGVAATNTIVVSIVGVILATALGIVVGVARISGNWLVSRTSLIYIEVFRNVPLLVQLFFWFYVVLELPPVRQGYVIADRIYLNNAGLSLPWPWPANRDAAWTWLAVVLVSIIAAVVLHRALTRREALTGRPSYPFVAGSVAVVATAVVGWQFVSAAFGDSPFVISVPAPQGTFGRIAGGFTISGGLMALLTGLVIYTSSFIAEIVRAGIQSVGRGQTEAARSLGLAPMAALRHVTFPQALRVIIPPLISQFLNLTKNSSLAGAIGYSDLANVAKTMTQTAPAVSIYVLLAAAYLAMSLAYSLIGNLYNRSIRLVSN